MRAGRRAGSGALNRPNPSWKKGPPPTRKQLMKLIRRVTTPETAGITLARGVEVAEPKPGLVIDPSENEKIQPMFDLIALLSDKDMLSDVGVIDLSKLYDIQFTYLDRFTVKLGSAEQTDRKLQ